MEGPQAMYPYRTHPSYADIPKRPRYQSKEGGLEPYSCAMDQSQCWATKLDRYFRSRKEIGVDQSSEAREGAKSRRI
ncbi:hypothetical protein CDL15_Pgr020292 [Punica granatum]|uniref:Uncharacterized protein n=1 Tax=Punica granatum TaxID=22663 RepID=A0A218VS20_PUNGR|nr:hypothetical protein CDL15_Pgr020292 [Punica granatum]